MKEKKAGLEKGIEQGILKVAKELIALGLDNELIQKATGLSVAHINALNRKCIFSKFRIIYEKMHTSFHFQNISVKPC